MFNATFNNISIISRREIRKKEYPDKTTDLSQVTDKLVSSTPRHERDSNGWVGGSGTVMNGLFTGGALNIF